MDILVSVLLIVTFFGGALAVISIHMRQMSVRRALPLRDAYQAQHGKLNCLRCSSGEQREFGLDDKDDDKRVVACAACNRELFQYLRNAA